MMESLKDNCNNPLHSDEIRELFENEIAAAGSDLWGIIEIKETIGKRWMFKIKDFASVYVLFYQRDYGEFYFVPTEKLKGSIKEGTKFGRSFTMSFVRSVMEFSTKNSGIAKKYALKIKEELADLIEFNNETARKHHGN